MIDPCFRPESEHIRSEGAAVFGRGYPPERILPGENAFALFAGGLRKGPADVPDLFGGVEKLVFPGIVDIFDCPVVVTLELFFSDLLTDGEDG